MKMAGFNTSAHARLFPGFFLGGPAVRHGCFRRSFGEGPLIPAVAVDQQEFNSVSTAAVAHSGDLHGQCKTQQFRRCHPASPENTTLTILSIRYFTNVKTDSK